MCSLTGIFLMKMVLLCQNWSHKQHLQKEDPIKVKFLQWEWSQACPEIKYPNFGKATMTHFRHVIFLYFCLCFLYQVFTREETTHFFQNVLPRMVDLALQLPYICTQVSKTTSSLKQIDANTSFHTDIC